MDFNAIKYIFQIPIEWYKKIHNRVFNAYGTNFLTVREGYYGGTEIGIDSDGFADEVNRVVDLSSVVKSVDYVDPDEDGNVQLCAAVLSADQTFTGSNTFSEPILLSSYGQLSAGASTLKLNLGTNGITLSGSDYQLLDDEPSRLYSQGADNQIATRGYCRLNFAKESHDHGNINNDGQITAVPATTPTDYYIAADSSGNLYRQDLSSLVPATGLVKSVNDTFPDENGNIEIDIPDVPENIVTTVNGQTGDVILGNIVNSVNGVAPVNGDVDLGEIVYSVNNITAVNGNVEISCTSMDEVTAYIDEQGFALTSDLADYALTSDLTNYALTSDLAEYAHTVDGHPAIDGEVDFALLGNKWVMTNSSGNLTTTNLVPISLSSSNNGYLFSNNGSLEFKQDEYVTLGTEQTLSATKRFDNCNVVAREGGRLMVTNSQSQGAGTNISESGVTIANNNPNIFLQNASGSIQGTMYIGAAQPGLVLHAFNDYIELYAPANKAVLDAHPTDTALSSKAIATVGYCQSNFGKVKSVNNNYPDSSGNVTIAVGTGTVNSVDGVGPTSGTGNVALGAIRSINGIPGTNGNFGGVVTSVNSTAPTNGNVDINAVMTVNNTAPDSGGNVDVGTVRAVDGHSPDSQGAVSFGLGANCWVKTDSAGHLYSTNENVATVPAGTTPQTGTVTVVVGVSWNGTSIVITKNNLNFTNGLLTSVTNATGSTIATVPYT